MDRPVFRALHVVNWEFRTQPIYTHAISSCVSPRTISAPDIISELSSLYMTTPHGLLQYSSGAFSDQVPADDSAEEHGYDKKSHG